MPTERSQRGRATFLRAWLALSVVHALLATAGWVWAERGDGLPETLREPASVLAIVSVYGPIALADRLGVPRDALENASFVFGDPTAIGWLTIVLAWALFWAAIGALWASVRGAGGVRPTRRG